MRFDIVGGSDRVLKGVRKTFRRYAKRRFCMLSRSRYNLWTLGGYLGTRCQIPRYTVGNIEVGGGGVRNFWRGVRKMGGYGPDGDSFMMAPHRNGSRHAGTFSACHTRLKTCT